MILGWKSFRMKTGSSKLHVALIALEILALGILMTIVLMVVLGE